MSRADLEQMFKHACQLLVHAVDQLRTPFVLLDDQVTSQTRFVEISGALVKATVTCQSPLIVYDPANNELIHVPPNVTWDLQPCREGDLLNAMDAIKDGHARVQLRKWCEKLRQADEPKAQAPLQVEILHPEKIGATEKILRVVRDDTGKMTGAVSEPIS